MTNQCQRCGLPQFDGAYAYAGPVCKCGWRLAETVVRSAPRTDCLCIGPQIGQPRCPCQMRGVIVRDGRYIQPEQDLGPVRAVQYFNPLAHEQTK